MMIESPAMPSRMALPPLEPFPRTETIPGRGDGHIRRIAASRIATASRLAALLAVASLVTASAASAQAGSEPPSASFGESVEVRLVEIEVSVDDARGRPVEGLRPSDFELEVDGESRSIDTFVVAGADLVGGNAAAPPPAAEPAEIAASTPPGAPEPIYLAVYLDRNYLEKEALEGVKEDLKRFLTSELGEEARVLLAVSGEELRMLAPFGTGLDEILARIDAVEGSGKGGKLAADFRFQTRYLARLIDDERRLQAGIYQPALDKVLAFYRESLAEMERTAWHLSRLLAHLAGLPGRRQMLYVGGPIPTASASLLFERWRDTFERSAGGDALLKGDGSAFRISGLAQEAQAKNKGFQAGVDLYGSLAEAASASGVVIHSLGLTTIRNSRDTLASRSDVAVRSRGFITASPDFAVDSRATLEMDEGLRQLSGSTGGTYFEGYKKADRFFGRVGYQLDHRYVIGFYAPATDGELEVKVTLVKGRRKLVRHRRLVRVASINQELATRTRAALLDLSDGDNRLGVKVEVTSVRRQEDQWVVAVAVAVPIGHLTLVDDGRRHAGQLWIYATAGDPARAPAKVMRVPLEVAVPRERLTSARSRDAEYAFELTSTEAPTRVAVTVRDDFGPDSATVGADVVLPEGS